MCQSSDMFDRAVLWNTNLKVLNSSVKYFSMNTSNCEKRLLYAPAGGVLAIAQPWIWFDGFYWVSFLTFSKKKKKMFFHGIAQSQKHCKNKISFTHKLNNRVIQRWLPCACFCSNMNRFDVLLFQRLNRLCNFICNQTLDKTYYYLGLGSAGEQVISNIGVKRLLL